MGSSKERTVVDSCKALNKPVTVMRVLDHHSIAAVQWEIRVSRDGTAALFTSTPSEKAQGSQEGYAKKGTTYLNDSAILEIESHRAAGNQLHVDDVITFSAHKSAPSFVVRAALSDLPATSFSLLKLPECVLLSSVLPHLPLGTLAKFVLASADCAQLAETSMTGGHRWGAQSTGIVRALEAVKTRLELMRAVLQIEASVVQEQFNSEDKATRKAAKQVVRAANAHFNQLEGEFVLGSGPRGLTVYVLPQKRAPLAEL